jgi:hypothetical protein
VSLDLDEIRERAVPVSQGAYRCVRSEDFNALVAEVERLRGDRAAVVAWMLKRAKNSYAEGTVPGTIGYETRMVLEAIERGEHRREEEP